MKVYIVTRHHFDDRNGVNTFKTAAFTTLRKAREFLRDSFKIAVKCWEARGYTFEEGDACLFNADRAWLHLSDNERNERQWNITTVNLDGRKYSDHGLLD